MRLTDGAKIAKNPPVKVPELNVKMFQGSVIGQSMMKIAAICHSRN